MIVVKVFSSTWCKSCKNLKEKLYPNGECVITEVPVLLFDVDEDTAEVEIHKIMHLPTILIVDTLNNTELAKWIGDVSIQELKDKIHELQVQKGLENS